MSGFRYALFWPGQDAILPSLLTQAQPSTATNFGLLGQLIGANMNVTSDQAISINALSYRITQIVATNASLNMTNADGGIYPAASKAGTAIVAAGQIYTALTAATIALDLTLNDPNTVLTAATIYLSLTGAQGAAATADFYVFGERFS
jgi:hypothetical protein